MLYEVITQPVQPGRQAAGGGHRPDDELPARMGRSQGLAACRITSYNVCYTKLLRLNWYDGPTLIDILEATPGAHTEHAEAFRFPVQYVCRPQDSANPALHDYRGFMGSVESGTIKVGDAVT